MKTINWDIFEVIQQWFNANEAYWKNNGFEIRKKEPSQGYMKNSLKIEIDKGNIISDICIWDTGECDFQQIYTGNGKQKYFKNIILTTPQQTFLELDKYFCYFFSLEGNSIDAYHPTH